MSFWPLYRESLLQGPSHVSLSLPGKPSNISKSVGGVQPALLMIPNLEYLNAFISGNVGISDTMIKGMVAGIINSPEINRNEDAVKSMARSLKLDLPDVSKFKDASGKINVPISEIKVPERFNNVGMQGVEKTIMKSIFETQKPFMDVTKSVLGSMVKIEDVVARVMPLLSINPLTSKSERPIVKDGSKNGTKAIGYQNGIDFKKVLAELEKISKKGSDISIDKDGNATITKKPKSTKINQPNPNDQEALLQNKKWETVSVVYSTGEFDPTVDYLYSYVLLPPDDEGDNNLTPDPEENLPENPYDKYKPKKLIFGLFKADGTPLNPKEKLKTVSLDGILASKADTNFNWADWVYKSPKWKFRNEDYVWPSLGAGTGEPIYLWDGPFFATRESKKSPGDKWSIKKYKEGDKNRINPDIDAIPGDPIIVRFDSSDTGEYTRYFGDFLASKAKMFPKVDATEKQEAISDIMGRMDTQSHLQNVFLYGSGPSSVYRQYIPPLMKKSFKPYQIYAPEAVSDPYLDGTGLIWIDPEADYEFKVIRVDPSSKISYRDAKGEPVLASQIKAFVKNRVVFELKNGEKFNLELKKNGSVEDTATDVTEYTLENWNYENGKVNSFNFYNVRITYKGEEVFDETYTGLSLPDFGVSKKITVDPDSFLDSSTEEETKMPIYNIKVTDTNSPNGVLINPDAISNDFLATAKLFSEGVYGNGTKDKPQDLEILTRFARTDLDTESYYIIEGVLVEDNKKLGGETNSDASGDDGKRWYRLPHAIGAIIPFLSMLFDLAMKMFPNITKILKLFKDPTKFITDIITDKLGESFDIFSEPAFDKFKATKDIISKKKDIISQGNTSDYVGQIQSNFNTSPLVNHVSVDKLSLDNPGKFNFLLDGVAMIPFEIFGKSIPFGMELKMSNLVPEIPPVKVPDVPKVQPPKIPDPKASVPSVGVSAAGATVNAPTAPKVEAPKITVPNVGIPSVTLPKVQSPIKFIKGKVGKAKYKDCADAKDPAKVSDTKGGQSNSDYLAALNNPQTESNAAKKSPAPGTREILSTWYSTGQFINGVDYNYYYVTEDQREILKDVDELMYPGSTSLLNSPDAVSDGSGTNATDEDLQLAKEKLEAALSKDPTNELLLAKLRELKGKLLKSAAATQPIIKMVLGIVSGPIKVILCIVQWLFDFFKSILNPMMLPAKIIELLSFKWIMKFFSPAGLMQTFGINYNPAIPEIWKGLIAVPTPKLPDMPKPPAIPDVNVKVPSVPSVPAGVPTPNINLPSVPAGLPTPNINLPKDKLNVPTPTLNGGFPVNTSDVLKNVMPSFGDWVMPDDFQIGDMTQFLDVAFMAKLPTYSAQNLRLAYNIDNLFASVAKPKKPDLPKLQKRPILCLIEKLINAFIDFIWSLLGIEVIIPPPHIKLCDEKKPDDVDKLKNGDTKTEEDPNVTEIVSTNPFIEKPVEDYFVYEVKYDDGRTETFKNYEDLQSFIDANQDTSFDVNF